MLNGRNLGMEIAKLIGEPIRTTLPVPTQLDKIVDFYTAEPGEHVWAYSALDSDPDVILTVDSDGAITVVKRSPLSDTELTFTSLNSKLEYVLVDDILGDPDTKKLAARKTAITRGMDKRELYAIIQAIQGSAALGQNNSAFIPGVSCGTTTVSSGEDVYDVIMNMKHDLENYGDNYTLFTGSTVKEKVDTYDKDQASTLNYNVELEAMLSRKGIELVKVFGQFSKVTGEDLTDIMSAKKAIMIAKDSTIDGGKPIKFVRRKISPQIAQLMGADVDNAQRAIVTTDTPVNNDGTNTLAYGVYGVESVIFAITNPKAITTADLSSII